MTIQRRIRRMYDHLYANAQVKTPAGIAHELGKVAHTCAFIEQVEGRDTAFPLTGAEIRSLRDGRDLISSSTPRQVRRHYEEMRRGWGLYRNDAEISLSDFDINYLVSELAGLSFTDPKHDLMGDIFEQVRSQFSKEKGGQFFTDPQVTHLAMKLLEFDPFEGDDLVDICAGTGGFLLAGMAHLEERFASRNGTGGEVADLISAGFIGVEIDRDAAENGNATIRARFGRSVDGIIAQGDSLTREDHARIRANAHRCVATNPPFGTKITIKDPATLRRFDVARLGGRAVHGEVRPTAPDILFLERNLKLLDPRWGRLAIVVPYQLLSGPQALALRRWLLDVATVRAVIDLPADTFQPHTGTKGALLVLTRRNAEALAEPMDRIFFARPEHVGHDRRGNTIYERSRDGGTMDVVRSDFPAVAEAYRAFRRGDRPDQFHDRCFSVPLEAVLGNPSLNLNAAFYGDPSPAGSSGEQKLGDLIERIFVPGRFKRDYADRRAASVPFLGGANITDFIVNTAKALSLDDPRLEALRVRAGWVLVTRSGTTGIVSTVPEAWDGFAVSEHVIRIVPDMGKVNPGFIYAVLSSGYGQAYLRRGVFGSVIDEISPEHIAQMPIPAELTDDVRTRTGDLLADAERMRSASMRTFEDVVRIIDRKMTNGSDHVRSSTSTSALV